MYLGKISAGIHTKALTRSPSNYYVPTFILQPIVENAIVHGLETKAGAGRVDIHVIEEGDILKIDVVDDGKGMDRVSLEKVIHGISTGENISGKNRHVNIGLHSINSRLRILFGPSAKMEILSKPGEGTKVSLSFPWMLDWKENKRYGIQGRDN
jgi:two-component system sensor histidine kinase YesM